jgi:hypothetical protein
MTFATEECAHIGPVEDMAFDSSESRLRLATCGFPAPVIFDFEKENGVLSNKMAGSVRLDFCQRNVFFYGGGLKLAVLLLESHEVWVAPQTVHQNIRSIY